jgi:signal transduction histidine kinase/ActR/RegA family two-component response regulator
MTQAGAPEPGSTHALRSCIRDLTSLLALPAIWSGKPAAEILQSLCQVIESTTSAEVILASGMLAADEPVECVVRKAGAWMAPTDRAVAHLLDCARAPAFDGTPARIDDPELGPMWMLRLEMSYYGRDGFLCVGSRAPGFPSENERVFLRAAASLVAGSLNSSRLLLERERAARAKDEFLAMLGHELRNPLSPIVTALHVIKMRAGDQFLREQEIIERQLAHLTRLVDDLLDISRLTRGKVALKLEPLQLGEVVAEAVESVAGYIAERRHALTVDVADGLVVRADLTRLTQVLQNLLVNAAKYTDPGGRIELTVRRRGDEVQISVRDNGIGIEAGLLPKVFDLFTQSTMLLDRAKGGLGIGLALVKSLVGMHGGRVTATSDGPGHGSEFLVWLPVGSDSRDDAGSAGAPRLEVLRPVVAEETPQILLVDDNCDAVQSLAQLLAAVGYEVAVAGDAIEALSLLEKSVPRVAILDIGLPGMNGYELAGCIRRRLDGRTPALVALTGYGQEVDRECARQAGFGHHIVKPVEPETLLRLLQELVGRE